MWGSCENVTTPLPPNTISNKDLNILIEYEAAKESADGVERKVKKIHSQIMEITGGKMQGAKKALADLNKKLDKTSAEITRLTVATKTATR